MASLRRILVGAGYRLISPMDPKGRHTLGLVYRRSLMDVLRENRVDCVIDVGANRGDFVAMLRKDGYGGRVLSFEPNPLVFAELEKKRFDSWQGFPFALGATPGKRPFHVMRNTHFSSFLKPSAEATSQFAGKNEVERTIEMEVKTLDSVLTNEPAGPLFLKLDTQGHDLEVLAGAEKSLTRVIAMQSEMSVLPIYAGMPSYLESLRWLDGRGFKPVGFFPVTRHASGALIEFDCVLVRHS